MVAAAPVSRWSLYGAPFSRIEDAHWVGARGGGQSKYFSNIFEEKWESPEIATNVYSEVTARADADARTFLALRYRITAADLGALRADRATGPDLLPARILREWHRVRAHPPALLGRRILATGAWPRTWCAHWRFPLHKNMSLHDPRNYRGIQLAIQI